MRMVLKSLKMRNLQYLADFRICITIPLIHIVNLRKKANTV